MALVETPSRPGPSPVTVSRQGSLDAASAFSPLGLSRPGAGASANDFAFYRAATDPDVFAWLDHVRPAAACAHPIRLVGEMTTLDRTTGQLLSRTSTEDMPDGAIYKPCGNRRATVCPSCADTYRRDAYQLIRAGLVGGKGVPDSVNRHPAVFPTFTAPGFGPVHTRHVKRHTCANRRTCDCRPDPCHARRGQPECEHGQPAYCYSRHDPGDPVLGQPLCLGCYDHNHQVIWNHSAGELWRRTTIAITRHIHRRARTLGIPAKTIRLSYGKVAEMQRRGVVHFHAIIRLDGTDPDNPDAILPPPAGLTVEDLVAAVEHAAATVGFTTDPHPAQPAGWPITWGEQIDTRPIVVTANGDVTDSMVAGYLAKYATKSTETTGHLSRRLTSETIDLYADPDGTHTERLIEACWILGQPKDWRGLRRWAHMFGFGGHFLTKSRRYSVTFRILRDQRVVYARTQPPPDTDAPPPDTTLVVNFLAFAGAGWHTTGDALLANTSAALARERQRAGREEITTAN
jgi:hypothetical protein